MPKEKRIKCLIFSRIVGFYAPVDSWNPGKQEEFKERKMFTVFTNKPLNEEDKDEQRSVRCVNMDR